jgi:hypothetical protein
MVATANTQTMQGIAVPNAVVNPVEFFRRTRRLTFPFVSNRAFSGLGTTDTFSFLQTGIVAGVALRLVGSVVTLKGTGAIATNARWPYDLAKKVRISANGQSNLINCSGWKLKARDMMALEDVSDRGVIQSISGANVQNGTLSMASESWGLGQSASAIADGTYNFDIMLYLPVAYDRKTLVGAIFAQTAATDLTLAIDWANLTDLFTQSGTAATTVTCAIQAEVVAFSIPEEAGQIIIPDLSAFHGLIENRNTSVSNGDNEIRLVGQGVGRQLMRFFFQTWNGATPQVPLALTDTNYGAAAWKYGANDTPESWITARALRQSAERLFNCDLGGAEGFGVWDFAVESAFRDSIDEGAATELRFLVNYPTALTLTNPAVEYVQETIFAGAVGA